MFRQLSQMNIRRTLGRCILAATLLPLCNTPAKAQTTSDDLRKLADIYRWVNGAVDYLGGAIKAIDFITGKKPPVSISLKDIKQTFIAANNLAHDQDDILAVERLAGSYRRVAEQVELVLNGPNPSPFAIGFLSARLAEITTLGENLALSLRTVLRLPSSPENDQRVAMVMTAYVTLVPLYTSSMKLLSEIDPAFSMQGKSILEELTKAQQDLFMAAGAYVLHAHECGKSRAMFYSPVGTDSGWMFERPLYEYYHALPNGGVNTYPALRFEQYQVLPLVKLALDALESITDLTHSLVWTKDAHIFDLGAGPGLKPPAPCVVGSIVRVRQ